MSQTIVLKPRQIKAARALLDWSQDDLAQQSNLSVATIRKLEAGNISPRGKTNTSLCEAFEGAGLEFLNPDGVRHRSEEIVIYDGEEGVKEFYDDVYNTAGKLGGDVVCVAKDANVFSKYLGEHMQAHIDRMTSIMDKASVKVILTESKTTTPGSAYAEYRYFSQSLVNCVFFYVYGGKAAFRLVKRDVFPRYIVIQSSELADALREQFFSMWDKAVPVSVPQRKTSQSKRG